MNYIIASVCYLLKIPTNFETISIQVFELEGFSTSNQQVKSFAKQQWIICYRLAFPYKMRRRSRPNLAQESMGGFVHQYTEASQEFGRLGNLGSGRLS